MSEENLPRNPQGGFGSDGVSNPVGGRRRLRLILGVAVITVFVGASILIYWSINSGRTRSTLRVTPTSSTATPSVTPTITSTPTPTVTPTTTSTPAPQHQLPQLNVAPGQLTEFCVKGEWPDTFSVKNTGNGTLNWQAAAPSGVSLTPGKGSIGTGQPSQAVAFSGKYQESSFTVNVTSNGGAAKIDITCK